MPQSMRRQSSDSLLDRIIWIALLVLIPLSAIPHGLSDPWWLAAFECAVFATGALWIVNGFLIGYWRIRGWALLVPLVVLCVFVFLQAAPLWHGHALSPDPLGTRRFLFQFIALVTFGQLLLQATSSRRRSSLLIYVTSGVVVASAFYGLLRLIIQHNAPDLSVSSLQPTEAYGQLFNRNYFASMLVMILGLDLGLVVAGGVLRKHLVLHLGIIMLLGTSVVLTNSRGGIFAMMVLVVLLASLFVARRSRWNAMEGSSNSKWSRVGRLALGIPLIFCLVIAMAVAVTKLGGDPLENRMEKLSAEVDDNAGGAANERRADVWQASWRLIKANPIVGVGFGAYRTAIPLYHNASGSVVPETAINGYLDFLSGGGLVACAILAWFLVAFLRTVLIKRNRKDSFEYAARLGALAGLFGFAVHSLVDNGLNVPINAIILTVLIVISTADWQTTKRDLPGAITGGDYSDGPNVLLRTGTMSRRAPVK